MKKVVLSSILIIMGILVVAQAPEFFSYQVIVRDASYTPLPNQNVSFKMSILKGSISGSVEYTELHLATTNSLGLVTISIGAGTDKTGDFTTIDWATDKYFLKVEIDPAGGTSYIEMGTTQLLSVPYAIQSKYANNLNIKLKDRLTDLFIMSDGSLWVMPKISIEYPYDVVPSITDIDGNIYSTVKIGTQVWMAENLKTTKYKDNTAIPLEEDNDIWAALTTPAYCWLNNDISNKNIFGALYNWFTVNTNKLCPSGWHVPTETEFNTLYEYLGKLASLRLCEAGTAHWEDGDLDVINDSKFTALPGGRRYYGFDGFPGTTSESCHLWSSTIEATSLNPFFLFLSIWDYEVSINEKYIGCSVRCIKD